MQRKIFELCVHRLNTVDYLNNGRWFSLGDGDCMRDCLARCLWLVGTCLIVLLCAAIKVWLRSCTLMKVKRVRMVYTMLD